LTAAIGHSIRLTQPRQGNLLMILLQMVFVALAGLYGLSMIFTIMRDRQL
jgi:hypothetical protein